MSQLKRKRDTTDNGAAKADAVVELPYLASLPAGSAELADVQLQVEGQAIPVHSFTLLQHSSVFVTAISTASSNNKRVCQVPLPGESRSTVLLVLKHLYQPTMDITSIADAEVMSAFAHKHELPRLMKQCSEYLAKNITAVLATKNAFGWAQFAEQLQMRELLAHCERYITLNYASFSESDKNSDAISRSSLMRIMDGLAGLGTASEVRVGDAGLRHCMYCQAISRQCECKGSESFCHYSIMTVDKYAQDCIFRLSVPNTQTYLKWQQRQP